MKLSCYVILERQVWCLLLHYLIVIIYLHAACTLPCALLRHAQLHIDRHAQTHLCTNVHTHILRHMQRGAHMQTYTHKCDLIQVCHFSLNVNSCNRILMNQQTLMVGLSKCSNLQRLRKRCCTSFRIMLPLFYCQDDSPPFLISTFIWN